MHLLGQAGKSISFLVFSGDAEHAMVGANMCYSVLCSEMAVKMIDSPFITSADDKEEWAL